MKKLGLFVIVLFTVFFSSGCWDTQDLSEKAYIAAIGLDEVKNPETKDHNGMMKYKVTVEIVKPALFMEKTRGMTTKELACIILTAEGESIESALDLIQAKISRPLSLAHLRVLVIGDAMTRESFKDIISYFEKNPEVARRLSLAFVQNGEAKDVIETKPLLGRYVAEEIVAMSQLKEEFSLTRISSFADLISDLRNTNGRALGSRFIVGQDMETLIRHGASVFDDWHVVGWLSAEETKQANWIVGEGRSSIVAQLEKGIYTYVVDDTKIKIIPSTNNGPLKFLVKLKSDGIIIQERQHFIDLTDPQEIKELEVNFSKEIQKEIEMAIAKAQQHFKVDYLGFSTALHNKNPQSLRELNWTEVFPNVPIEIEVDCKITRFGLSR